MNLQQSVPEEVLAWHSFKAILLTKSEKILE